MRVVQDDHPTRSHQFVGFPEAVNPGPSIHESHVEGHAGLYRVFDIGKHVFRVFFVLHAPSPVPGARLFVAWDMLGLRFASPFREYS